MAAAVACGRRDRHTAANAPHHANRTRPERMLDAIVERGQVRDSVAIVGSVARSIGSLASYAWLNPKPVTNPGVRFLEVEDAVRGLRGGVAHTQRVTLALGAICTPYIRVNLFVCW